MIVEITDHAGSRSDGGSDSRCDVPNSILKNIVKRRKGEFFWDSKHGNLRQVYNSTVIVVDFKSEDHAVIATVFRDSSARAFHSSSDRYNRTSFEKGRKKILKLSEEEVQRP